MNLVGNDAIPGFFDGELRQRFGVGRRRIGHRGDNPVDLILGEFG